ncbi:porin family protein [Microvirga sp. ACRRW]|uniref:outer membrane protein n=1 Tax=Microvirga sp. ACRRW TaxID=2918205 RepID=UPI001EF6F8D9|nr:outer membrane beta-barrel protein [Microvirga sp. ACRRW]MCG7391872.1 porin family protein [Microvirga sp. ACRRW]
MKKILLASVALFGFAGAATAADLPARAAPPAPIVAAVPLFTWTGFYVGVNAGYGWHNNGDNTSVLVPGGAVGVGSVPGTITFNDDDGEGFVGGGQIGYNYQMGSFVIGLEADLQWADLGGANGTAIYPAQWGAYAFQPAGVAGGVDWFGTVRARAGVAFDRALVYATGGFAYGGADDNNDFFSNNDDVRTGWVLGAGFEYAFTNNLTAGIEGLWVNLDNDNRTYVGSSIPAVGAGRTAVDVAGFDRDSDNDFFVARAKLNYKFSSY